MRARTVCFLATIRKGTRGRRWPEESSFRTPRNVIVSEPSMSFTMIYVLDFVVLGKIVQHHAGMVVRSRLLEASE
jgi:hypothetical protein